MTSASGALKSRQRYGKTYREQRQWLNHYDRWPLDRKLEHHNSLLADFISFARSNSRFYRSLYGESLEGPKITSETLSDYPIVDKEMLRANIQKVYTIDKRSSVESHTGGTTGKPLVVRYTVEDMMKRMALLDHFKSRVGFQNGVMLRATFSGKPIVPARQQQQIFWRYNRPAKQMLYSTFHINDSNLPYYVEHLNKLKPAALDGFVSSLSDIAGYIERTGAPVKFQPVGIFPTAETLTPQQRSLLERVFNCKVYDQYASSEGAPFVTECSLSSLHIELSSGVFEHINETAEILVTSFHTHGTPLIRYRIGDSMEFRLNNQCDCGLAGPLVKSIEGRAGDYLLRTDGAKVNSGHISNLFKNLPNVVIQAQVIQRHIGEIDILLVTDDSQNPNDIERTLHREVYDAFGSNTSAHIYFVDHIPRAASGKHRLVRNLIDDEYEQ